eukprot:1974404-Amphidinium_carterae.2
MSMKTAQGNMNHSRPIHPPTILAHNGTQHVSFPQPQHKCAPCTWFRVVKQAPGIAFQLLMATIPRSLDHSALHAEAGAVAGAGLGASKEVCKSEMIWKGV